MTSRFSPPAAAAFETFFLPWMRRKIRMRISGLPRDLPGDRPLILAANHVSWWDGFLLREVQRLLRPAAPLFSLMTAREVSRFPFFRWLGCVPVDPSSPASLLGALRLLQSATRERSDAVISLFAQGRIWPSHRRPLGFQRGLETILHKIPATVLPIGIHPEMLNAIRPTMFVTAGVPQPEHATVDSVERAVEAELDSVRSLVARLGEDAPVLWPDPFDRWDPERLGRVLG